MRSHFKRTIKASVILTAICGIALTSALPAQAAPPSKGYPTNEIKAWARDVTGYSYPIRRGFYDSDVDKGFGFDKIYHKHNLRSLGAIQFVFRSPHITYEGKDVKYTAYANKLRCNTTRTKCTVDASYKVYGIGNKIHENKYYNQPVGGILGVKTTYCIGVIRCPDWATGALDGTLKPLNARSAATGAQGEASSTSSPHAQSTTPSLSPDGFVAGSYEPIEFTGTKSESEIMDLISE